MTSSAARGIRGVFRLLDHLPHAPRPAEADCADDVTKSPPKRSISLVLSPSCGARRLFSLFVPNDTRTRMLSRE